MQTQIVYVLQMRHRSPNETHPPFFAGIGVGFVPLAADAIQFQSDLEANRERALNADLRRLTRVVEAHIEKGDSGGA